MRRHDQQGAWMSTPSTPYTVPRKVQSLAAVEFHRTAYLGYLLVAVGNLVSWWKGRDATAHLSIHRYSKVRSTGAKLNQTARPDCAGYALRLRGPLHLVSE